MGEPVPIALGSGSRKTRLGLEGVAEFVNAYIEDLGDGAKTGFVAYAINGLEEFCELSGGGEIRGVLDMVSYLLVVSGNGLYAVSPGGLTERIGGIPSEGLTTMARNNATTPQVIIVASGSYFIYSDGEVVEGDDTDLPPPVAVVGFDNYFVFLIADGRWFIAGPNTADVDGLDFAEAESNPDGLVMGAVRGPDLMLMGQKTIEFWHDTGAADFPFTRQEVLKVGCYAAGTVANAIVQVNKRLVDSVIWAATDHEGAFAGVYMLEGYTPLKISTDEIDRLIRDETDKNNLRSMAWSEDGHVFYAITGMSFTRVFDTRLGEWHTRKTLGSDRWRGRYHASFAGMHLFGDHTEAKLYRSRPTLYDEIGDEIPWSITIPTVHMFPHRFEVNALYVDALTGVGSVTGESQDMSPELVIDYTKDGGASYSAPRRAALGAAGQRKVRVKERSFGHMDHNGVAFRLSCSARVVKGIQQLMLDADKLGP